MALDPASLAMQATGQGIMNGISLIRSIRQRKQAKELEGNNPRPVYEIPQEQMANQNLAQQMATQGLPAQQYNNAIQNISRNATSALSGANDRRSGLAAIGAIQQGSNDATNRLDATDAQARINNIRALMHQNNITSQYRNQAFDWNSRQKYLENAAAVRGLKGASAANMDNAIQGVFGLGSQMASANPMSFGGSGGGYTPRYNVDTSTVGNLSPQQLQLLSQYGYSGM